MPTECDVALLEAVISIHPNLTGRPHDSHRHIGKRELAAVKSIAFSFQTKTLFHATPSHVHIKKADTQDKQCKAVMSK
jgi:hypothetical protein